MNGDAAEPDGGLQGYVRPMITEYGEKGSVRLGPVASYAYRDDPKHLAFTFSRYKFCAKMLDGKENVLDAGCADGLAIPLLLQTVGRVHAVDIEPFYIEDNRERFGSDERLTFEVGDLTEGAPSGGPFDGAVAMDVIEHIDPSKESVFMDHLVGALTVDAICVVGTPNVTASVHQSKVSQEGHINLKNGDELLRLMRERFVNAALFSMNDEVVHTGYYPMAHYLLGVGFGVVRGS